MINSLNVERITVGDPADLASKQIVVLGLYESSRFRLKIMQWLPRLDFGKTTLVIIDNHSMDDTWTWLQGLIKSQSLECKTFLIRNQMNFGGYGSLASNLDLLNKAEWITTLHQDDFYEPDHINAHSSVIAKAPENLGIVSSEAVSVDERGKKLGYPKPAWLLGNEASPVDVFLAHLKLHALPFSGASFRTTLLEQIAIPWHSTAFPDSEIIMRAATKWRYTYLTVPKVEYFENPASESHLLTDKDREAGVYFALVRVFRDSSFFSLCEKVELRDLESFTLAINDGIATRVKNPELRHNLQVIAQESIVEALGPNRFSSGILAEFYRSMGDVQATRLLDDLAGSLQFRNNNDASPLLFEKQLPKMTLKIIFLRLASFLPRIVLKKAFVTLMKTKIGKRLFPIWNFTWKKR